MNTSVCPLVRRVAAASSNITEGHQAMLLGQEATSCRQAVEWGMRGLQGSFPRLKDCIIYEENGERAIILKFITLLYNYRV